VVFYEGFMPDDLHIFAGSGSPRLTASICAALGTPVAQSDVLHFSEGNLMVRVRESVRGRHVFIVQALVFPANDNFVELLFWMDALKRASAASVTAVIPYFSYAKGDKIDEPRVSIRARVCADALEAAGVDRVVALDLHSPQVQGFFRVPVDDLHALPILCDYVRTNFPNENWVVVSPDIGFAKKARRAAARLGCGMAICDKERVGHDESVRLLNLIGDVAGKTALIVDDFTLSCGTLIEAAHNLQAHGATRILAAVTHGVFARGSMEKLDASPVEQLIVTDSIETQPVTLSPKVRIASVAPLLAEAIRRIHWNESVSALYGDSEAT
jgi:ribose-phosphate pyrophosphokinase